MFSERPMEQTEQTELTPRIDQVADEVATLEETIGLIDQALSAEDFNDGDRTEVERSREFFEARYNAVLRLAGHSIKSAKFAA